MIHRPKYHLTFPVRDLANARNFCRDLLGGSEGRTSRECVDLFNHRIIAHLTASSPEHKAHNFVDGREVPVWHFDVIRFLSARKELAEKLHARGVSFIIKPQIRFEGLVSEQTAFGTNGFGGNLHKVKAFANDTMVFAS